MNFISFTFSNYKSQAMLQSKLQSQFNGNLAQYLQKQSRCDTYYNFSTNPCQKRDSCLFSYLNLKRTIVYKFPIQSLETHLGLNGRHLLLVITNICLKVLYVLFIKGFINFSIIWSCSSGLVQKKVHSLTILLLELGIFMYSADCGIS